MIAENIMIIEAIICMIVLAEAVFKKGFWNWFIGGLAKGVYHVLYEFSKGFMPAIKGAFGGFKEMLTWENLMAGSWACMVATLLGVVSTWFTGLIVIDPVTNEMMHRDWGLIILFQKATVILFCMGLYGLYRDLKEVKK